MSLLDKDFGFREITTELLGSIGFKPTSINMWIDGVRVYPYDLFIRIPGVTEWTGAIHLLRYFPDSNKLEVYENKTNWSCAKEYSLYVDAFDDICVIISKYN